MEKKKLLITAGICFGILWIVFLIGILKTKKDMTSKIMAGPGEISYLVMLFKDKNSRWPLSTGELHTFLVQNKSSIGDYDLSPYQNLFFLINRDHNLKIHFDGYKKGNLTLGPSDMELNFNPQK